MDSHTVMAVRSLIDSQNVQETLQVEEEDVFQCGKCKQKFTNLSQFFGHKQNQCIVSEQSSDAASSSPAVATVHSAGLNNTNVIYTTQLAHSQSSNQITLPANTYMVPLQNISQGMLLTEDMISFHTVNNAATVQVPVQTAGGGHFLASAEVASSNEERRRISQPESSGLCAVIPSTVYPSNDSGVLQSHNRVAVSNPPSVVNQMELIAGRLNNRIVLPLPAIQAIANVQIPVSQAAPVMPDADASSALIATQSSELVTTVASSNAVSRSPAVVKPSIVEASSTCALATPRGLPCQYCDKSFTKNFDLLQHTRSHTGEKPFQCIVCGRAFAQKSNVKKHLQTHKVWPRGMSKTLPEPLSVMEPAEGSAVSSTMENTLTASSSSSEALCTTQAVSSSASLDVVPASSSRLTEHGDVHIIVEKQTSSEGTDKLHNSSTHIVVHNKTSSSRIIRTVVHINANAAEKDAQKMDVVVDNSYVCQYCSAKFDNYFQLKSHMVNHKDEQVYKCVVPSCGESFQELDAFLEHIRHHEHQMSYRCHQCNKQFHSLSDLGMHQYAHSLYPNQGPKPGPKYFRCSKCNNKYASPESLQHHMETTSHVYNCPNCQKVFTCERYLRRHLPTHDAVPNHVCSVCTKSFKTDQYLRMHMIIHSTEKPFQCDICNHSFKRKDKLKRHMVVHDPVKRYKCPLRSRTGCTKEFNRPDKLKAHIISHAGAKPHWCQTCGRTFTRRAHLREHERFHADNFRFWCERCNQGFMRQNLLKHHRCTAPASSSPTRSREQALKRKVGRPRKTETLPPDSSALVTDDAKNAVTRRGRTVKKSLAAAAADNVQGKDTSVVADKTVTDEPEQVVVMSGSDTLAAVGSSDTGGDVEELMVDSSSAAAADSANVMDIPSSSVTISSLDDGTLYVLQPVKSVEQSLGCRTLRLLRAANDQDDATPRVLVAAPAAEMISSSADFAHFLCSAGITGITAGPVSHAESTSSS